jgi:hypothetical protein
MLISLHHTIQYNKDVFRRVLNPYQWGTHASKAESTQMSCVLFLYLLSLFFRSFIFYINSYMVLEARAIFFCPLTNFSWRSLGVVSLLAFSSAVPQLFQAFSQVGD